MSALTTSILVVWAVFWIGWLVSAFGAKESLGSRRFGPRGAVVIVAIVLLRVVNPHDAAIHSVIVRVVGVVLFAAGLALAVWARIYLGRNWGMPMTERAEPELVTSGPYQFVRHPIYSGILLGLLGTALATNLYWLIAVGVIGVYFVYSATVEERLMTESFPTQYPAYRARTKMLIPFVL